METAIYEQIVVHLAKRFRDWTCFLHSPIEGRNELAGIGCRLGGAAGTCLRAVVHDFEVYTLMEKKWLSRSARRWSTVYVM